MKTYDMIESTHGDDMRAFSKGFLEKSFKQSMCKTMTVKSYTFPDGLVLRFDAKSYQRRIDKCLKQYMRDHGEPASVSEETVTRDDLKALESVITEVQTWKSVLDGENRVTAHVCYLFGNSARYVSSATSEWPEAVKEFVGSHTGSISPLGVCVYKED